MRFKLQKIVFLQAGRPFFPFWTARARTHKEKALSVIHCKQGFGLCIYNFDSNFIYVSGILGKIKGTNHLRLSGIPLTVATSRSWRGWVAPAAQNLSLKRREGDSNPRRLLTLHDFQSCTFDHSDISPNDKKNITKRALLFKFFRSDRDSFPPPGKSGENRLRCKTSTGGFALRSDSNPRLEL